MPLYAHTPSPDGTWHLLEEHLRAVADLAAENAAAFGADEIAWWAGILHDAGTASVQAHELVIGQFRKD
jgi:HD superfamily phosphohydrolase YqeK